MLPAIGDPIWVKTALTCESQARYQASKLEGELTDDARYRVIKGRNEMIVAAALAWSRYDPDRIRCEANGFGFTDFGTVLVDTI